jgi:hypothetical protein
MSLKQAAIQQDAQRVGLNQMLAAGDFAGGAKKGEFHADLVSRERPDIGKPNIGDYRRRPD